jgi:hypothetical protein
VAGGARDRAGREAPARAQVESHLACAHRHEAYFGGAAGWSAACAVEAHGEL